MKNIKKSTAWLIFIICSVVFLACGTLCFLYFDALRMRPLQRTMYFDSPAMAKFERDGNLYVIDNGSFRLICADPEGRINYKIEIDMFDEYIRIVDGAIDESGNLYIYAVEAEYNALMTKRDIIRKYDNSGQFVKDILSVSYDEESGLKNPRLFYQFGSFRYEDGTLSFSQTQEDKVTLYQYDTYRDELRQSEFPGDVHDFSVAQLVLKDMDNYAYVLRDGDIYEVTDGGEPELRASFDWSIDEGGIIPWYIFYNENSDLVFFDLGSNALFRLPAQLSGIAGFNDLQRVVPERCFDQLKERGEVPSLKGFGFYKNTFAGVYGEVVWLYDGVDFTVYDDGLLLPLNERLLIIFIQIAFVLGVFAFIAGLYVLFVNILDRYISLFIKMSVILIPLLIIAFVIVFSITFNKMTEQLHDAVFNEMIAMASLSARMIDGDDVHDITSTKDFHSDGYKRLSTLVKEIVGYNADPWNQGFYAAIYKGDNFEHIVVISNEEWNLFRPDEALEGEDYDAFMSGEPIADIYDLFNGTWACADVPIYNSAGEITGMFEVGLDMTAFEINNAKLKRNIAITVAIVSVLILLSLCLLVYVVIKRLSSVVKVLQTIAMGDRSARVHFESRDELGSVSSGLNNMAKELQDQFDRITWLHESSIRFVPIQFMEQLGVTDITKMKLGDNIQRDISVMFFDIRYFSINSEMMTARENFMFINKILGIAGPIIRKYNGFVDKFIGDAVMSLFNDGADAVRAGIELYKTLVNDEKTKVTIGLDGIKIGIGVHTGSVMMGIVGEEKRLSSTVISANVNLASRLEGLSKQTGSGLLITRDTLNQLSGIEDQFAYRFIGMVQAAGVNEVIGLFDMLDALPLEDRERRLATKANFESGVRKYHMKDYATAVQRFEKVVAKDKQDVCAANHLDEAKRHLKDPSLPSFFVFSKK